MQLLKLTLIFILSVQIISCSATKANLPEEGTLKGTIHSIGNEPFTKLGIHTSNGEVYILKCTKEIETELRTKQGNVVKIFYNSIEALPSGKAIMVVKFETISNN